MNSAERRLANSDRLFFSFTLLYLGGIGISAWAALPDTLLAGILLLLLPLAVFPLVEGIIIGMVLKDSLKWRARGWTMLIFAAVMTGYYVLISWIYRGPLGFAVGDALIFVLESLAGIFPVQVAAVLTIGLYLLFFLAISLPGAWFVLTFIGRISPRIHRFFQSTFRGITGFEAQEREDRRFGYLALAALFLIVAALVWLRDEDIWALVSILMAVALWGIMQIRAYKQDTA